MTATNRWIQSLALEESGDAFGSVVNVIKHHELSDATWELTTIMAVGKNKPFNK